MEITNNKPLLHNKGQLLVCVWLSRRGGWEGCWDTRSRPECGRSLVGRPSLPGGERGGEGGIGRGRERGEERGGRDREG